MAGCQDPGPLDELRGTVKRYGRHVLACAGWTTWQERIEDQDDLLGRMARDVKQRTDAVDPPPKLTALRTEPRADGIDLIVFPDQLTYRGVDAEAWETILRNHLLGGTPVEALDPAPVDGHHVLVCNHGARDLRCGACGPLVADALQTAIEERSLDEIHVHRSSHVGGHRFAGNVIVYPAGDWYGYVRPEDTDQLLDAISNGQRWQAHHRGAQAHDAADT